MLFFDVWDQWININALIAAIIYIKLLIISHFSITQRTRELPVLSCADLSAAAAVLAELTCSHTSPTPP